VLGFRAIAASDGPSALAACFEHRPDLCILDVSMPAGDLGVDDRSTGFEVCRRIKRDPRTKSIPVIFVTALNDTTDRVKAIEAGGDDFLTKPHNRLVLGARVRSLLKLKGATDSLEDTLRKLREVEKMRDDLMKMIVHDLKTPLTAVLASIEMLMDGDLGEMNEEQRKMLGDAEGKAEDLLALIGDLLEVSRIEEASMTLDLQPIAPAALLNEIVHEWTVRFQQEGATASIDVADDAPVFEADKAGDSLHSRRQRSGHSCGIPRGDLPQVRAGEESDDAAHAQLRARSRLLQARRRRAWGTHLGPERR
jgi:two-component system, sensor histidine kinase and response regulator